MPISKLPQNRMTRMVALAVALFELAALGYMGWSLSGTISSAFAHTVSDSDTNGRWAMRAPWGLPIFVVTIHSQGYTSEHRDGQVMLTDYHYNFVHLPNGRCGQHDDQYPTCFALVNPHAVYSHATNEYTLTGSDDWDALTGSDCFVGVDDLAKCWESDTSLGWFTIPIDADMNRAVVIQPGQSTPFIFVPCMCGSVTITNEYQVD